eukprot:7345-Heterococcus_DN1.PRE.1
MPGPDAPSKQLLRKREGLAYTVLRSPWGTCFAHKSQRSAVAAAMVHTAVAVARAGLRLCSSVVDAS